MHRRHDGGRFDLRVVAITAGLTDEADPSRWSTREEHRSVIHLVEQMEAPPTLKVVAFITEWALHADEGKQPADVALSRCRGWVSMVGQLPPLGDRGGQTGAHTYCCAQGRCTNVRDQARGHLRMWRC